MTTFLLSHISCHFFVSGFCNLCSQSSDEPGYRGLSVCQVWGQPGGPGSHSGGGGRHRLRVFCRPRVTARQDAADILGLPHLLGTGRPLRCEFSGFELNNMTGRGQRSWVVCFKLTSLHSRSKECLRRECLKTALLSDSHCL